MRSGESRRARSERVDGGRLGSEAGAVVVEVRREAGDVVGVWVDGVEPGAREHVFAQVRAEIGLVGRRQVRREHRDAPRATLRRGLADGDGRAERAGEEALGDPGGAEDAAVCEHPIEFDAFAGEHPHAERQRAVNAVQL